jgi:NTE family protein
VLAPMATYARRRHGQSATSQADRRLRSHITRQLHMESGRLTGTGTRVRILAPEQDDLMAMGINLMNPKRRKEMLETDMSTTRERLIQRLV